jgi:hypothetical protein
MTVEIAEADQVAGEGELDNVLAAVGPLPEKAKRTRFDAIDVQTRVTFAEDDVAGGKRKRSRWRAGRRRVLRGKGGGLDDLEHGDSLLKQKLKCSKRHNRLCGAIATINTFFVGKRSLALDSVTAVQGGGS